MKRSSHMLETIAEFDAFPKSGKIKTFALLILRVCQLVWSASMIAVIAVFLIMLTCSATGMSSEPIKGIMGNIGAAFLIISIAFHSVTFIIRAIFIEYAPSYLSDSDFIDHLKAKRLYMAILLMNSKGRPASQAIIGAGMLCNEIEIVKMSRKPNKVRTSN